MLIDHMRGHVVIDRCSSSNCARRGVDLRKRSAQAGTGDNETAATNQGAGLANDVASSLVLLSVSTL